MVQVPIRHITLYKHGVGFYERKASFNGEKVELTFRVQEMNDILKSLTVIDWGKGKVLGIDYATPQNLAERLEGCSIHLSDDRSLQDLIVSLRGRAVRLLLDQGETAEGTLVGIDRAPEDQPIITGLVSLLLKGTNTAKTVPLSRLTGLDLLDERGAGDLKFFLSSSLTQERYRQVSIRLTPGEHELSISYIAPAPTWRVSYRLVTETVEDRKKALLFGWGIFDNRLEEDLEAISLSLVAGMPISFVYDLYNPYTPDRPIVKEERRVVSGPVDFESSMSLAEEPTFLRAAPMPAALKSAHPTAGRAASKRMMDALEESTELDVAQTDMGELFQYIIQTPVTVGRGQSAMVPILTSTMEFQKDLLYNGRKISAHPVATLRLLNRTGLALERGPVTVLENGEYVGEAVLPFTPTGKEIVVPYAVELGIKISEDTSQREETRGLYIRAGYLVIENWEILTRTYRLSNTTSQKQVVLVEHPRHTSYDLANSPEPKEITSDQYRFEVTVPSQTEVTLVINERRLISRKEELRRQSLGNLSRYLQQGILDEQVFNKIAELLRLWEKLEDLEKELVILDKERDKVYRAQQQIQGNMGALSTTGKEGEMRNRYVTDLEDSEGKLRKFQEQETLIKQESQKIEDQIQAKLQALQ